MKLSNCDFEGYWQGICLRYEQQDKPVPRRWRLFRRLVGAVLRAGVRGRL